MSSQDDAKDESDIEMYHRLNLLKEKAGGDPKGGLGQIDPKAVSRADTVIMDMASLYPDEIKNMLNALNKEWTDLKGMDDADKKAKQIEKLSNTANQIKDLGTTFGYNLMGYFGESLRDFILKSDLSMEEHYTIVQAHIDVMGVAFRENLKDDDGGLQAEELKKMVRVAIEKYSPEDESGQ